MILYVFQLSQHHRILFKKSSKLNNISGKSIIVLLVLFEMQVVVDTGMGMDTGTGTATDTVTDMDMDLVVMVMGTVMDMVTVGFIELLYKILNFKCKNLIYQNRSLLPRLNNQLPVLIEKGI